MSSSESECSEEMSQEKELACAGAYCPRDCLPLVLVPEDVSDERTLLVRGKCLATSSYHNDIQAVVDLFSQINLIELYKYELSPDE